MDECKVDGCTKPVKVKKFQLCVTHYHRFNRHGDPTAWVKPVRPICLVDGCELRAVGKGLCDTHYRREKRYGNTELPSRPTVCLVDGCELPVQAQGRCDKHYRRHRNGAAGGRVCGHCGQPLPDALHARALFCGKECREKEHAVRRREGHRERWLKQYGLTVGGFAEILARQGGGCAICGTTNEQPRGSFCVDHDHATGRVRGILCSECNTGLGKFRDRPDLLVKAIGYLMKE